MRIAFVPSDTGAMAVASSGNPDVPGLLEDRARRSLFTELRDGAPPAYTFHALLIEFRGQRTRYRVKHSCTCAWITARTFRLTAMPTRSLPRPALLGKTSKTRAPAWHHVEDAEVL